MQTVMDMSNAASYVADRVENGWSAADVAEYRAEITRIKSSGSDDEKLAAAQFWNLKALDRQGTRQAA